MLKMPTVWIMIQINIQCVDSGDSRKVSREIFDDVEIIQANTRDEVLAQAYGIREHNKKYEPNSVYDSGSLIQFLGPFEVPCNETFISNEGQVEHYLNDLPLRDISEVNRSIDSALVLYQLIK
jgi:hypothetical protein